MIEPIIADIVDIDRYYFTDFIFVLYSAIKNGSIDQVVRIMNNGVQINYTDGIYRLFVESATYSCDCGKIKMLLDYNPNYDIFSRTNYVVPINIAVCMKQKDIIGYFLDLGIEIEDDDICQIDHDTKRFLEDFECSICMGVKKIEKTYCGCSMKYCDYCLKHFNSNICTVCKRNLHKDKHKYTHNETNGLYYYFDQFGDYYDALFNDIGIGSAIGSVTGSVTGSSYVYSYTSPSGYNEFNSLFTGGVFNPDDLFG